MDLYTGAGQCDITKGEHSGTVTVNYSNGRVMVTIDLLAGYVMKEAQLYIGGVKYPVKNGNQTVAPGQYPFNSGTLNDETSYVFGPVDVSSFTNGIYVIVHSVTCNVGIVPVAAKTELNVYHIPFEQKFDMDLNIPYKTNVRLEFMDLSGRTIMKTRSRTVLPGSNMLQYNIHRLATEVHLMRVYTSREVLIRKVFFVK